MSVVGAFAATIQNLLARAHWLSRLWAERLASRPIDECDADGVSGTPQHAALANTTLAMVKPQRELVGYGFNSNNDNLRTAIREIGQSA
jgi:hypothetical protein